MPTVEERLSHLEAELRDMQQRVAANSSGSTLLNVAVGAMDKWPEYDEVLRLGTEYRKAQSDDSDEGAKGA